MLTLCHLTFITGADGWSAVAPVPCRFVCPADLPTVEQICAELRVPGDLCRRVTDHGPVTTANRLRTTGVVHATRLGFANDGKRAMHTTDADHESMPRAEQNALARLAAAISNSDNYLEAYAKPSLC